MMVEWKRGWAWLFAGSIVLLLIFAGCGGSSGGGGGADVNYQGNSEPAEITSDNAQELAASAYDSSSLEGPFGGIASLTESSPSAATCSGRPTRWRANSYVVLPPSSKMVS